MACVHGFPSVAGCLRSLAFVEPRPSFASPRSSRSYDYLMEDPSTPVTAPACKVIEAPGSFKKGVCHAWEVMYWVISWLDWFSSEADSAERDMRYAKSLSMR